MARQNLYDDQPTTSAVAVYTSTNIVTTITAATVHNPTAGAATLTAWIGTAASDRYQVYDQLSVAAAPGAGASVGLDKLVGHTLDAGDAIYLMASANTTLSVRISGEVG